MDFEELMRELIGDTLKDKESRKHTWFDDDYINNDGEIVKATLISALQTWIKGLKDNPNSKEYEKLVDQMRTDDDLFDIFVYTSGDAFKKAYGFDWNVANLWKYYGYAIKKVIGPKAVRLSSTKFNHDYNSKNNKVIYAQTRCVTGYNWDINAILKKNSKELTSLLPVLRGKKSRKINEYLNYVNKKAKAMVRTNAFLNHQQKNANRVGKYANTVVDNFKEFSTKENLK